MKKIRLAVCCLLLAVPLLVRAQVHGLPQPTLTISMESGTAELGDSLAVTAEVTNSSEVALTGLRLLVDAPEFIRLKGQPGDTLRLGDLAALSATKRGGLVLKIAPSGQVGDFNLLFSLAYQWKAADGIHQGIATVEKTLKTGIFGTDKVVGIPLAFAEFIVPGLFFLFAVWVWGAGGSKELGTENKLIISIIVSVVCLFIVDKIGRGSTDEWVSSFRIDGVVSIRKLFWLGIVGFAAGSGYSFLAIQYKKWRQRIATEQAFRGNEKDAGLVYKALKINGSYKGLTWEFSCSNDIQYRCAHYFETPTDLILVGAFTFNENFDVKTLGKHVKDKHVIQTRKNLLRVIELAGGQETDNIVPRNPVKKIEGGAETDEGRYFKLSKAAVLSSGNVTMAYMELIELP